MIPTSTNTTICTINYSICEPCGFFAPFAVKKGKKYNILKKLTLKNNK
jgi:hypothetical protein